MKIDEMKMRIHHFVHNTIDLYLPPSNFLDKMKNATAKLWIDQNIWQVNKMLDSFGDEHGEIDFEKVIDIYEDVLFSEGELRIDLKDMIPDEYGWVKSQLPHKLILFKKEDLRDIFR